MNGSAYADALRIHFETHANPLLADRMSRYMLGKFGFFGIQSPLRKQLSASFIAANGLPDPADFEGVVKQVWAMPQRELQYTIMEMASRKAFLYAEHQIHLFEYMILQKSWWDTVDYIAANLVGSWLRKNPGKTTEVTAAFMNSGNMWLMRTVLLFQLKYRKETNEALLFETITALKTSPEFFIRKAIGWSLREYSKTNPEAVIRFVENNTLSGLSKREALKIITKKQADE